MTEIWKPVLGWEELYEVSNLGQVRSLDRVVWYKGRYGNTCRRTFKGKILRPCRNQGYLDVVLACQDYTKSCQVHRLVAQAFVDNPDNKPQVNHINGVKHDNRAENLEWVTRSENIKHAVNKGLFVPVLTEEFNAHIGQLSGNSCPAICTETGDKFQSCAHADRVLNYSPGCVAWAIKNNKPTHGLHFEVITAG